MAVTTLKSRLLTMALLIGSIVTGEQMAAQAPAGKRLLLKEAVSTAMVNNALTQSIGPRSPNRQIKLPPDRRHPASARGAGLHGYGDQ